LRIRRTSDRLLVDAIESNTNKPTTRDSLTPSAADKSRVIGKGHCAKHFSMKAPKNCLTARKR
jgi:hypothetical protein